ncbi:methionyl-tRNA formyltransferase [Caproiciproducens sp. NJN-50]|uniref:methionyl-tRNA formyltransferase n=1 Tax=Acutalibacteraceae TaxID=3082771 RepID=UPI000FFE10B5|nr:MULTISPECIES: methionyl-tRNA formyltransferase [Acutalibacteraceae]QAT49420.1 methionyl-tRNA formyltransferase [Caproiciproducens sp. NJN-50]
MKIIFMGTPEFAVPSLAALIEAGHEIAAVFTRRDRPVGRKQILTAPPVKVLALEKEIPVFQPDSLRGTEAEGIISRIRPDVIVVAAYGKILPKNILNLPRFGCVNVHASLLPKYRGAAPIQQAVLDGETVTGVTAMQMAEGLDTGDILLSDRTEIGTEETSGELTARLAGIGAKLVVRTLSELEHGTVTPVPQDDAKSSYASMLTKERSPIDWTRAADQIHNQVRGLSPWPGASTVFEGKKLKVHRTRPAGTGNGIPGQILPGGQLKVVCGGGTVLELLEVQPEGGKKMPGSDFLRGHPAQGATLGNS